MSVLTINKLSLRLEVLSKPGEKITRDKELKKIEKLASQLGNQYKKLSKDYKILIDRCHEWNKKHDKDYSKNVEKAAKKQSSNKE